MFVKDHSNIDNAIEDLWDFQRQWAEFRAPRLLAALGRIQRYVYEQQGYLAGNYDTYIAALENLGRHPVVNALDEYGLPTQIGDVVWKSLGRPDSLDAALETLRSKELYLPQLSQFENNLVYEVRRSLLSNFDRERIFGDSATLTVLDSVGRDNVSMLTYSAKTQFELGYEAGGIADMPPDASEMTEFEEQYIFGFIAGYSVAVSVRTALPAAAGWTAGELGRQYGIPLDTLLKEVQFEIDVEDEIREKYERYDEDDDGSDSSNNDDDEW
ncbi:DUF2623 family protein [Burkholderia sp. Bp9125]|nr:DUF2623 family protein [Burkholderia sp. Bp9125]